MKTVLITGGNRGIGLATARLLAGCGYEIWIGARSKNAGEEAAAYLRAEGGNAMAVCLDVTDRRSLELAVSTISERSGKLDSLVNNAGIMPEVTASDFEERFPPSSVPLDILRRAVETNFIGAVSAIQVTLPLLRIAPHATIVNVGSRLGSFAHVSNEDWPARELNMLGYSASKAALHMATISLSIELAKSGIKVNAVSPGVIATDLSGDATKLTGSPGYGTPDDGAGLIAKYCDLAKDGPTGRFFGPGGELAW